MKVVFKVILAGLLLSAAACKKDKNVLGVDVQPAADDLNAESVRDLPVTGHSLPYDSIASFNDRYKYVGSNQDPFFGKTDIGIYLNPNMSLSNLNFGASSQISSAEIILAVDGIEYAGNKDAVLTYSVFEMESRMNVQEIYFTSDKRRHNPVPVSVHATSYTLSANGQPVLKIRIDPAYAQAMLHDSSNMVTNEVFQSKYKGYYIAASLQNAGDEGVIFRADLDDEISGLYLRYKPDPAKDTISSFKFAFSGSTASKYNTMSFDPVVDLKAQFQDSTLGASRLYLKGMGMSRLKLDIPFLKNYSDSFKVAVNRAELILYADLDYITTPTGGRYFAPPKLVLLPIDSLGRETYMQDMLSSTDYARYDGNYDDTRKAYVFNIAREAQQIFSGKKKNRGFYLVVANADITLRTIYAGDAKELLPIRRDNYYQRIVLAGSAHMQRSPRFNLNYIRFKND